MIEFGPVRPSAGLAVRLLALWCVVLVTIACFALRPSRSARRNRRCEQSHPADRLTCADASSANPVQILYGVMWRCWAHLRGW
jgi:hypothetical protein